MPMDFDDPPDPRPRRPHRNGIGIVVAIGLTGILVAVTVLTGAWMMLRKPAAAPVPVAQGPVVEEPAPFDFWKDRPAPPAATRFDTRPMLPRPTPKELTPQQQSERDAAERAAAIAAAPKVIDPLPRLKLPPVPARVALAVESPLTEPLEVKLRDTAERVCLGGSGRYVVVRFTDKRAVLIYDVAKRAVHRTIELPEKPFVAAGRISLWVALPKARELRRYDLATGELARTVPWKYAGHPAGLCAGYASDGPVFASESSEPTFSKDIRAHFLDGDTFGEMSFNVAFDPRPNRLNRFPDVYPAWVRASADGRSFAWKETQGSGGYLMTLDEAETRLTEVGINIHPTLLSYDGRLAYSSVGRLTPQMRQVATRQQPFDNRGLLVPAVGSDYYLRLIPGPNGRSPKSNDYADAPGRVEVRLEAGDDLLATLADLDGVGNFDTHSRSTPLLAPDERIRYWPELKTLMVFDLELRRFRLLPLDPWAELEKSGADYLAIAGVPGSEAKRGQAYSSGASVRSKRPVKGWKLDFGPDGMAVSPDGKVVWNVPFDFAEKEVEAIVSVRDDGELERVIRWKIQVR